jgi:hypothetical protein
MSTVFPDTPALALPTHEQVGRPGGALHAFASLHAGRVDDEPELFD